jgi:hypothetical protein
VNAPAVPPEVYKQQAGKPQWLTILRHLPHALEAMVRVREYGNAKYSAIADRAGVPFDPEGWRRNTSDAYLNSAARHFVAVCRGERINREDGNLEHIAQAMIDLAFAYEIEWAAARAAEAKDDQADRDKAIAEAGLVWPAKIQDWQTNLKDQLQAQLQKDDKPISYVPVSDRECYSEPEPRSWPDSWPEHDSTERYTDRPAMLPPEPVPETQRSARSHETIEEFQQRHNMQPAPTGCGLDGNTSAYLWGECGVRYPLVINSQADLPPLEHIVSVLARKRRWADQYEDAISVARHSIMVAKIATELWQSTTNTGLRYELERLQRSALLHDAEESMYGDTPTPLKQLLRTLHGGRTELDGLAARFKQHLAAQYDCNFDDPLIKCADNIAGCVEARQRGIPESELALWYDSDTRQAATTYTGKNLVAWPAQDDAAQWWQMWGCAQ